MSTSITIRNVPDEVRDELAERAARKGQSLQAYLVDLLTNMSESVDRDLLMERIRARKEASGVVLSYEDIIDAVDHGRR
jgi:plasmid stability protein